MTTDVGSRFDAQPSRMSLDTVYPNPFNPSTNIRFTLLRLQQAKLEVYDVRGRNLSTIVDRLMQPGTYTCSWNAGSYPSGVYYFRLQTEDEVQHGKAMLIK